MKITELRVSFARTVNLGNFESARIEAGVTVAIEDGDDLAQVRSDIQPDLRLALEETWRAQQQKRGAGE